MSGHAATAPREASLEAFLARLHEALRASPLGSHATRAIERIFAALEAPGAPGTAMPSRRHVCEYLPGALATAQSGPAPVARVAEAFAAIAPFLGWAPRASGGPSASSNWPEGHANATIIGPKGLEDRRDLHIGVSLMAPHVRYPDHTHAPEEVYLVLSPGRFQHGTSDWFEPGLGGSLYNEPNIRHAMASDEAPLLALWCLWSGPNG